MRILFVNHSRHTPQRLKNIVFVDNAMLEPVGEARAWLLKTIKAALEEATEAGYKKAKKKRF